MSYAGPGPSCTDEAKVTVYEVTTVEWIEVNSPLDNNPNPPHPGGGYRIFAGKQTPTDTINRKKVKTRATITPVIEDRVVKFLVFDGDDPSANQPPIDDETGPADNRGTHNPTAEQSASTNAQGQAEVELEVGMNPGDNYKVVASCLNDYFDNLQATQNDGASARIAHTTGWFVPGKCRSALLTVWRELHVEVDSMAAPNATNTQSDTVQAPPTFDPGTLRATLEIEDLHADWERTDQHRVGRIDITGFGSFTTVNTILSSFPFNNEKVVIMNAPPTIVNANGAAYTLWDDDAGSVPPFTMIGSDYPPVPLPKIPDTGFMAEAFAQAYVDVPSPDLAHYDPSTPFDRQIESTSKPDVRGTANSPGSLDLTSSSSFWVVHVTSGFQGPALMDGDPDTGEHAEPGLVFGVTDAWDNEPTVGGSIVHLEVIRDFYSGNEASMTHLEQFTVVHEVGHQFYLLHGDGAGGFIMTDQDGPTPLPPIEAFSPCSLMKIRKQTYPQGLDPNIECE